MNFWRYMRMDKQIEKTNLCVEISKQRDLLINLNSISSKILAVLRGESTTEKEACQSENCLLDTIRNSGVELLELEKKLEEIANLIIG